MIPAIEAAALMGAAISVDTRRPAVMEAALQSGAHVINDVSALRHDPRSLGLAVSARRAGGADAQPRKEGGDGNDLHADGDYANVVLDVFDWLAEARDRAMAAGISRELIVLDPGIGFGKTLADNLALLNALPLFHALGQPLLLGASRKRFIGALSNEGGFARAARRLGGDRGEGHGRRRAAAARPRRRRDRAGPECLARAEGCGADRFQRSPGLTDTRDWAIRFLMNGGSQRTFGALALALIFAAAPAMAQEQAPVTPIEAPAQPGALALGTGGIPGSNAHPEAWISSRTASPSPATDGGHAHSLSARSGQGDGCRGDRGAGRPGFIMLSMDNEGLERGEGPGGSAALLPSCSNTACGRPRKATPISKLRWRRCSPMRRRSRLKPDEAVSGSTDQLADARAAFCAGPGQCGQMARRSTVSA